MDRRQPAGGRCDAAGGRACQDLRRQGPPAKSPHGAPEVQASRVRQLLYLHGDLNTSLAQELRQMVPRLAGLGLIGEGAGRPRQGYQPSLTLVFDRGSWDLHLL